MVAEANTAVVNHDQKGRFAPGNTLGGHRGSGEKRLLLAQAMLAAVSPDSLTEMVANICRIALSKKQPHCAIRAFSVLADCLGLKESTIQVLTDDGPRLTLEETRQQIQDRLAELLAQRTIPR
jgi:hypothetical protein